MSARTYEISNLGPIGQLRTGRLPRRLVQLMAGLALFGFSIALMVRGALGLAPWDVLHSGLVRWLPLTLGQAIVLGSLAVLLLWIPLGERPGIGTLANTGGWALELQAMFLAAALAVALLGAGRLSVGGISGKWN